MSKRLILKKKSASKTKSNDVMKRKNQIWRQWKLNIDDIADYLKNQKES